MQEFGQESSVDISVSQGLFFYFDRGRSSEYGYIGVPTPCNL